LRPFSISAIERRLVRVAFVAGLVFRCHCWIIVNLSCRNLVGCGGSSAGWVDVVSGLAPSFGSIPLPLPRPTAAGDRSALMWILLAMSVEWRSIGAARSRLAAASSELSLTSRRRGRPGDFLPSLMHPFSATAGFTGSCCSQNARNSDLSSPSSCSGGPVMMMFRLRRAESLIVFWTITLFLIHCHNLLLNWC